MTRFEIITELRRLREAVIENENGELTDYARDIASVDIDDAIEHLTENEE